MAPLVVVLNRVRPPVSTVVMVRKLTPAASASF
jgi:hypothetical protein